jgi:glycosyltransferase involved in cell wall biosynthesis
VDALRIALVTETYPPEINGVAMTLGRLVDGLRARGQQVSLIRPRQRQDSTAERNADECLVTGLPIPGYAGLNFGLSSKRRLAAAWRTTRPDIVHIATEGPLGWSALRAARSLNLPVVASFHTNFHNYSRYYGLGWLQRPLNAYLRGFHNRARLTLAPTRTLAERLETDGYRNLGVMARGVDTAAFHPQRRDPALRLSWGVAADDPALIYVGRLAPEKNLSLLVDTFRAIQAVRPGSRLVMVGNGPELRRLRQEHPDFILAGPRTGEDLARHYASADLFLFPSLTETFGNVLLEAMASGLATVAFDYAAASEHVQHGVNGVKASYGDENGFMRLATELVIAPETVNRLGRAARLTAGGLAWDGVVDTLLADYRQLLAGQAIQPGRPQ